MEVPPLVIEHLKRTRPWAQFCSIAGYVTSLFLLVIASIMVYHMAEQIPPIHTLLLAGFYLILAVLFLIPSRYLSRYEKSITHLSVSHELTDLEQALADQQAFWKQIAIMILFILTIYLITISYSVLIWAR